MHRAAMFALVAQSTTASAESQFDVLAAWLRAGGAFVNDKIVFRSSPSFADGHEQGIFVRDGMHLDRMELVAMIPVTLTIHGQFCSLVNKLETELNNGSNSSFAPYLDSIQHVFKPPSATLPNYWHDETKALLRGLPPHDFERHEEAYRYWCQTETRAAPTDKVPNDGRWLAARRALLLTVSRTIDRLGGKAMVPLFDAFNHCSGDCDNIGVSDAPNSSVLLHTRRRVAGGDQLFVHYTEAAVRSQRIKLGTRSLFAVRYGPRVCVCSPTYCATTAS
jgi:hypothetical protein